jgi:hypothetical protein
MTVRFTSFNVENLFARLKALNTLTWRVGKARSGDRPGARSPHAFPPSHFVFTETRGRQAIFWQTRRRLAPQTPKHASPRARALPSGFSVLIDARERYTGAKSEE